MRLIKKKSKKDPLKLKKEDDDYAAENHNPYLKSREPTVYQNYNPYAIGNSAYNSVPVHAVRAQSKFTPAPDNYVSDAEFFGLPDTQQESSASSAPMLAANPYESPAGGHDGEAYNPYAPPSRSKSAYDRVSPSTSAPALYGASRSGSPAPSHHASHSDDSQQYSPYKMNPSAAYSSASVSTARTGTVPPPLPANGNPYATSVNDDRADTVSVMTADPNRSELFQGLSSRLRLPSSKRQPPQQKMPPNLPPETENYDPSIMETEEERQLRYAPQEQITRNGKQQQTTYGGLHDQSQIDEDQDVQAMKDQIKYVKKESLSAAQNARRYAELAEASGLRTLGMLGEQGDRLSAAESAIAVTENQTHLAEDYARELKTLNRSMFAVHVANPFNSRRRMQEQEQKIRDNFQQQQEQRADDRRVHYNAQQRIAQAMGNAPGERRRQLSATEAKYREQMAKQRADLAQASRYQFEPDEEDFEVERDIDTALDDINNATGRLNLMAKSIGNEIDSQNKRIDKLNKKTQEVEIGVHLNTSRLARIR
ncbi:uncharacterized protein V1518DRAFT_412308 [Limtongia smithiae]|uniref:uncharacterized protein n=1 Tax=Limtongia smithiae TaxID=1125753 RepID=UPI0034CF2942